jgi:hypothetical protein
LQHGQGADPDAETVDHGYGAIADHSSRTAGIIAAALTAAAIIPLVLALRPFLRELPLK